MIRHQKYREMANFVKADFHIFQTITNRFYNGIRQIILREVKWYMMVLMDM